MQKKIKDFPIEKTQKNGYVIGNTIESLHIDRKKKLMNDFVSIEDAKLWLKFLQNFNRKASDRDEKHVNILVYQTKEKKAFFWIEQRNKLRQFDRKIQRKSMFDRKKQRLLCLTEKCNR